MTPAARARFLAAPIDGLTEEGHVVTFGDIDRKIPGCSLCASPAMPFLVGVYLPSDPPPQPDMAHVTYRVCPACQRFGRDAIGQHIERLVYGGSPQMVKTGPLRR